MTKEELRKIYLEKRLSLSIHDYTLYNSQLCENFLSSIDLSSVNVLHTFLAIEKSKEPDTHLIINRIRSTYPKIAIAVPRVNEKTERLENFLLEDPAQLIVNKWGIPEPTGGTWVPSKNIDLVLVPLLIFDKQGDRVGYGKGYYDKFLPECRSDCKRIGVSLFEPVDKIGDINDLDIRLQYCLTPSRVYQFQTAGSC